MAIKKTTALDIIKGALRPLGVLTGQTSLKPQEVEDALQVLNWMIGSWSGEPLTMYKVTRETFNVMSGEQVQTMGPGGTWDTSRPFGLVACSVTVQGVDYGVDIIGYDDYEAIKLKTLVTSWPQVIYPDNDFPLVNCYLWPVPTNGITINIDSNKLIQQFENPFDELVLPPGYEDALRYNLAVRLSDEYMFPCPDTVKRLAEKSLKNVKRVNKRTPTVRLDPSLVGPMLGGYNVYSDSSR